jgi:hypothetical protein
MTLLRLYRLALALMTVALLAVILACVIAYQAIDAMRDTIKNQQQTLYDIDCELPYAFSPLNHTRVPPAQLIVHLKEGLSQSHDEIVKWQTRSAMWEAAAREFWGNHPGQSRSNRGDCNIYVGVMRYSPEKNVMDLSAFLTRNHILHRIIVDRGSCFVSVPFGQGPIARALISEHIEKAGYSFELIDRLPEELNQRTTQQR